MRGRQNQLYHILVDPYIIFCGMNIHLLLYYTTKLGVHQGSRVLTHSPLFFWHGETVSSNQTMPFSCIVCRRDLWVTQRNVKRPLSIAQCQWRWTQVVDEWIGLTLPYMKNDSWLSSFCVYPRGWAFLRFDCRIETDSQQDWGPLGDGKRIPAACVQKKFGTFQFFAWWHRLREVYQWLDYAWLVMIRVIWRIKDWTSFNLPRTPAMAARIKATASSESNIVPEELAQGEQLPGLCWKFSKVVFGCIFGNQVNK